MTTKSTNRLGNARGRLLVLALVLGLAEPVTAMAKSISYLEHLQGTNSILCDAMLADKCLAAMAGKKAPKSKHECLDGLNQLSQADPANQSKKVTAALSAKCLAGLRQAQKSGKCMMDMLGLSIKGDCSYQAMQAK